MAADGYLVVHPNWWGQPRRFSGRWSTVLEAAFVYEFGEGEVIGHLAGKTAVVITTSNTSARGTGPLRRPRWKTPEGMHLVSCGVEDFTRA